VRAVAQRRSTQPGTLVSSAFFRALLMGAKVSGFPADLPRSTVDSVEMDFHRGQAETDAARASSRKSSNSCSAAGLGIFVPGARAGSLCQP
jgi:hypothetical protein